MSLVRIVFNNNRRQQPGFDVLDVLLDLGWRRCWGSGGSLGKNRSPGQTECRGKNEIFQGEFQHVPSSCKAKFRSHRS
jgi:hypothetical protein